MPASPIGDDTFLVCQCAGLQVTLMKLKVPLQVISSHIEPWTPTLSTTLTQSSQVLLVVETAIGMITTLPPPCLMLPNLSHSSKHSTTTVHESFSMTAHSSVLPHTQGTWISSALSIRLLATQFTIAMPPKLMGHLQLLHKLAPQPPRNISVVNNNSIISFGSGIIMMASSLTPSPHLMTGVRAARFH